LMKIEGKEIIKNTVEILSKYGVKEVMIATPIANKIIPLFNDMQQVNFIYIDDNCSGTAGAVKLCEKYINSDFFVVASDIYFDFDLNKMMMFHKSHGGLVTIATTTTRLNESKDQIEFEGNRVIKFDYGSRERTFSINAGIYAMSPKIFEIIPKKGSLEKDVFPKLTSEGKIYAYNFSGKWIHIS
ncbi:MAG: sugar phosphate nucleotidyltransferase, partial [Candidatus Aenigmatarchaeota archaeon]